MYCYIRLFLGAAAMKESGFINSICEVLRKCIGAHGVRHKVQQFLKGQENEKEGGKNGDTYNSLLVLVFSDLF